MKKFLLVLAMVGTVFSSCDEGFDLLEDEVGYVEIVAGLKQALEVGTDTAVAKLNVTDGFFGDEIVKILLPEEAQPVYDVASQIPGISNVIDETILAINRSAEDAAVEAKPIFVDAITNMTLNDATDILYGEDTAATSYLRTNTYQGLYDAFKPKIETSLSKDLIGGLSAEDVYSQLIGTYNTASIGGLLWDRIESNSLSEHTTNKALRGLFIKVGEQEKGIRENPVERVTELLEDVFALQDDQQ